MYSERELIQRAIQQAVSSQKFDIKEGYAIASPQWSTVKNLFACGSTQAEAICWKYGFDPEVTIK